MAQGLSRSLLAFSSFIRDYIDPVIKADQCALYVDEAAITLQQLIKNLRAVFQCLKKTGPTLSMAQCQFKVKEVDFLGRIITTKGVAHKSKRSQKSQKNQISTNQESTSTTQRIFGILSKLYT